MDWQLRMSSAERSIGSPLLGGLLGIMKMALCKLGDVYIGVLHLLS